MELILITFIQLGSVIHGHNMILRGPEMINGVGKKKTQNLCVTNFYSFFFYFSLIFTVIVKY